MAFFHFSPIFLFFSLLILLSGCDKSENTFNGQDGLKVSYYPDGKVNTKVEYKGGLMHGKAVTYDREGKLKSKLHYYEGHKQGESKLFYSSGKVKSHTFYKKSRKDSLFYEYYESGNIKKEGFYKLGKLEGKVKSYHENGKLSSELNYKNDKKHGEQKYYYNSGQLKALTDFYEGRPGIKLEEYTSDGKRIKHDLKIVTKEVNKLMFEQMYFYQFSLNKSSDDDEFYMGELDQGKYFPISRYELRKKDGYFVKEFYVPKYAFLMEKLTFIASTKTHFGNDLILTKTVNVAINNY